MLRVVPKSSLRVYKREINRFLKDAFGLCEYYRALGF